MVRWLVILVLGLNAAALGGWYVWWDQFARSPVASKVLPARPAVIQVGAERLGEILENAPWVSPGLEGGVTLYKIGFRACSDCLSYKLLEFDALHAAGVDTRVLLYAPRSGRYEASPEEQAVLAELYRTRDWDLYEAWYEDNAADAYYARPDQPPPVAGDMTREALVETGRDAHDDIAEIMAANGWGMERPAMFWRDPDDGLWRVYMGDTDRGRAHIRRALGVPLGEGA